MTPTAPPTPTLGQAGQFFRLLLDLGLVDAVEKAQRRPPATPPSGRPSTLAEASGAAASAPAEPPAPLQINLGEIWSQIALNGAYTRLAVIIWGVTEEEAEGYPLAAVRDAVTPFAIDCWGPSLELLEFVRGWE